MLKKEIKKKKVAKPRAFIKEKARDKKPAKKIVKKAIKKPVKKVEAKPAPMVIEQGKPAQPVKVGHFIWAVGKRKTAIARVQLLPEGQGEIFINKKSIKEYFPYFEFQKIIFTPLKLLGQEKNFRFRINVKGGGIRGQAEAVRLGITRALVAFNPDWRKFLKSAKLLTRDARKKERKKPGLKRARRAPQWQKR